jgi:fumarate hydratase class II
MSDRIEKDSLGEVRIPGDKIWGPQTQRSLENFPIGEEKMPMDMVYAIVTIKKAAAEVNFQQGLVEEDVARAIVSASEEILGGEWKEEFPLSLWQTGSGTQTNMNVNEVLAHRANEILGVQKVHANDHVNCSQSSNDVFPSAMHMAALANISGHLLPALKTLENTLSQKKEEYQDIIKIGRTHLQDATPLTLGQEISGFLEMIRKDREMVERSLVGLQELALGGTAVGTGFQAPEAFGRNMAALLSQWTGIPYREGENKFYQLTSKGALLHAHGAMKTLACDLMKMANDIRFLASGPRCGLGELSLPSNEPGSSIMPGKVNPTQCEALTMVCVQVMGNDTTLTVAASQGNFQLNVYMPVIIYNFLQSVRLLGDAVDSFEKRCVRGIKPVLENIQDHVDRSLMLVTALSKVVGYDQSAKVALKAHEENRTLKEAAMALGVLSETEYDLLVDPKKMVGEKK